MFHWQIKLPVLALLLVAVFTIVSVVKARLGVLPQDLNEIPLLDVETRFADLGSVEFGSRNDIAFRFENLGGKRVVIHEVDQACACGEPIRRSMTLDGRAGQDWVVNFETAFQVGPIEKTWHFISSDPTLPRFALKVRAEVERPCNASVFETATELDTAEGVEVFSPPSE